MSDWNEQQDNDLAEGVYNGLYTPFALPLWLYAFTALRLDASMIVAFSGSDSYLYDSLVSDFKQNIARFSGAKTVQNVIELANYVYDSDSNKRPFAEFKAKAKDINANYNINWLKTEETTAFAQAQNARKFAMFLNEKEMFPVIEYRTVGDGRVRPSHLKLNGFKARVDDPIWRRITPQNEWGCRCILIQHYEQDITSVADRDRMLSPLLNDFKKKKDFDMNPYYDRVLFKDFGKTKASYFNLPREVKGGLDNNFGLPSVDELKQQI